MRLLLIAVIACGLLAGGASAMSTPVTHTCAAVATPTGLSSPIKATRVACPTARKVAKSFTLHGKVKGWKCSATPFEGGAKETCKRTTATAVHQAVRFSIAD